MDTKTVIKLVGARPIAEALGISLQAVYKWNEIPAEHCPTIERLGNGSVRCEQMRPDVDWGYLRGTENKAA